MYLLDTNICIDFLHGELSDGFRIMRESPRDLFKLPAVVVGELLLGVEKAPLKWQMRERRKVEVFLEEFEVIPFDERCARELARIRAGLELQGLTVGSMDILIAATAIANQAVLITNDAREFERIPGLRLESWHDISGIWEETAGAGTGRV
ncbi:MAG: type II toxin-antitoxin system VapC family toxin [Coriobacteriia bacterium]|nr:type II toxin-antitoxin system VapC family toxin [Coriobacteriia bacterium]